MTASSPTPQQDKQERCALYARVSYYDAEGENLAGQFELNRQHADGKGYLVVAELAESDKGASGADPDLPQLNRALELAESGEIDVLVVRELDRFARDVEKQLVFERLFRDAGARVEYALADYPDTPTGKLNKTIRAAIAEFERALITERMRRGLLRRLKRGDLVAAKELYGYRFTDDTHTTWEIVPAEAEVVRQVFEWYVNRGWSCQRIAQELKKRRVPTASDLGKSSRQASGPSNWYQSAVSKMLGQRGYMGEWVFSAAEGDIVVEVPAIVDAETWQAAAEQRKRKARMSRRNTQHNYLMRARLTCYHCGYACGCISSKTDGKLYLYYRCSRSSEFCKRPAFKAERVDLITWGALKAFLADPGRIAQAYHDHQACQPAEAERRAQRVERLEGQIAEHRGRLERLVALYANGDLTAEVAKEQGAEIGAAIEALQAERAAELGRLQAAAQAADKVEALKDFAGRVAGGLEAIEADFDKQRRLVDTLDVTGSLERVDRRRKLLHLTVSGLDLGQFELYPR